MKRTILLLITYIHYSTGATPPFQFGPMAAAPAIGKGRMHDLVGRQAQASCIFGVPCGAGCATQGPCCDNDLGVSCRMDEVCVSINNNPACCPQGSTCDSVASCLDADNPACSSRNSGGSFCCDSSAPFCNTSGELQLCQATASFATTTVTGIVTATVVAAVQTVFRNTTSTVSTTPRTVLPSSTLPTSSSSSLARTSSSTTSTASSRVQAIISTARTNTTRSTGATSTVISTTTPPTEFTGGSSPVRGEFGQQLGIAVFAFALVLLF